MIDAAGPAWDETKPAEDWDQTKPTEDWTQGETGAIPDFSYSCINWNKVSWFKDSGCKEQIDPELSGYILT